MFKCVTIEVKLANCKHMVIACVYRAPGSDVTLFCDTIDRLFNQVAVKKTIFICGGFNIDLLKHDLTRFNKIAIPNNKFQMAKWTRKPLAYRESNNFLISLYLSY